jgi:hypothetical protein
MLQGNDRLIDSFDFNNIQALEISLGSFPERRFSPRCLPSQVNKLSLTGAGYTFTPSINLQPHSMPNLVSLHLKNFIIEVSLQAHLELPNLKHLDLDNVSFKFPGQTTGAIQSEDTPVLRVDMTFSPKLLNLESLRLRRIAVDESLILELQSYHNLHSLTIQGTDTGPLFFTFSKNLNTNATSFPSLRSIKIECSWTEGLLVPYQLLVNSCSSRQPHIDLYLIKSLNRQ